MTASAILARRAPLRRSSVLGPAIALAAWTTLVAAAAVIGRLPAFSGRLYLPAPPLYARWAPRIGIGLGAALVVGAAGVLWGHRVASALSWRRLLAATVLLAAAWAFALAALDGAGGITGVLHSPHEYLRDVPRVGSPGPFLATFIDRFDTFATHVQGHPPGLLLVLSALDRVGLSGAGWTAALFVAGGASAAAAVLVAVREVAGEDSARTAAPFLALAPAAIWVATSADALYAGAGAWGVALIVVASGRRDARGDAAAAGGGVLLGASAFLTYGALPLGAIVLSVCAWRRRVRPVVVAACAAAVVALAFLAGGFWWLDGLRATVARYHAGVGGVRPWTYFLIGGPAAFAVALGPSVAVALSRLRDRGMWTLCGGALAAVAVANLSGLSKGEVERIWLPFAIWVLAACAALRSRAWLALHAGAGLLTQVLVRSPW